MNDDAQHRAEAFVRRVESAMAGAGPARRAELTDGLADHLLEPGDDGLPPDRRGPRPRRLRRRAAGLLRADHRPPAPPRNPHPVGAAVLALLVAIGTWAGITRPWEPARTVPAPTASTGAAQVYVPNVRGLSRAEAVARIEAAGLTADLRPLGDGTPLPGTTYLPSGTVADQDPANGTPVDRGSAVILMLTP